MIKKEFTASARRARNIIWNAAGRYDFEPPFMAFFPNGSPDHYFNMMAGLLVKWLDLSAVRDFFESYGKDRRTDIFDDLLWLGLENCLYEKEVSERPILEALRKERAGQFFREQARLTRQQMEYQSMLVYTQQEIRWAGVTGRPKGHLTPKEAAMADALLFSGDLDTDGVIAAMSSFLEKFFHYTKPAESVVLHPFHLLHMLPQTGHHPKEKLVVRAGADGGDHPRAVNLRHTLSGRLTPPSEEDETWIRSVFGPSAITEGDRRVLETDLCRGEDALCRIYVTGGTHRGEGGSSESPRGVPHAKEAEEIHRSALLQKERNTAFLKEHGAALETEIRRLASKLETVFSEYFRHLPEQAQSGRLQAERAYRLPVLRDNRVFLKSGEETETGIFVDLLIDASQSRMNAQEVLSAEAYIVAKSLARLHIPVRITSFRSIRGYTVLDVLKAPEDTDVSGCTRFFAAGWNRDSLALSLAGHLDDLPSMRDRQRILLIMTDASPNDAVPLLSPERPRPAEYEGEAAVRAAESAVRRLRARGIRVGAVFHGNTIHMEDLGRIYGHAWVRIRRPSGMAEGVSDLLLMLMRELQEA